MNRYLDGTRWLTSEEAAEVMGVDKRTIHKWVRLGKIDAIKFGGRTGYRVSYESLQQYAESRRVTPFRPHEQESQINEAQSVYMT